MRAIVHIFYNDTDNALGCAHTIGAKVVTVKASRNARRDFSAILGVFIAADAGLTCVVLSIVGDLQLDPLRARMFERLRMAYGPLGTVVGLGSRNAEIMLVTGGRSNRYVPDDRPDWPYISNNFDNTCSGWLNGLLESHGIPEAKLCWVSSKNRRQEPLSPAVLTYFPRVKLVVSMGKEANLWVSSHINPNRSAMSIETRHSQDARTRFMRAKDMPYTLLQHIEHYLKGATNASPA